MRIPLIMLASFVAGLLWQINSSQLKQPDFPKAEEIQLLLSSLDDASRNAVVCANLADADIIDRLAAGHQMNDGAISAMVQIVETCGYASAQLNTVSENVHALMVREMDALTLQTRQAMAVLEKCNALVTKQRAK